MEGRSANDPVQPEHIRKAHVDKFADLQILKLKILVVLVVIIVWRLW